MKRDIGCSHAGLDGHYRLRLQCIQTNRPRLDPAQLSAFPTRPRPLMMVVIGRREAELPSNLELECPGSGMENTAMKSPGSGPRVHPSAVNDTSSVLGDSISSVDLHGLIIIHHDQASNSLSLCTHVLMHMVTNTDSCSSRSAFKVRFERSTQIDYLN